MLGEHLQPWCQHIQGWQGQVAEIMGGDWTKASTSSSLVTDIQDSLQLMVHQKEIKWDHCKDNWGFNIVTVQDGLKIGSKALYCSIDRGTG